ncbi:MAG: 50S ribosomal protein L15 [Chitinispirillaceae bacterium]
MKLNEIEVAAGSRKKAKRVGRGQGSGNGCTSGYGMNGDKARSGSRLKLYFEGGQTPLSRRIPKRGFNNPSKVAFQIVNVGDLEKAQFDTVEIDPKWFYENGFIHTDRHPVKVLGNGELSKKLTIRADAFSKSAREKIEQAKGKAEVISRA